MPIVIIDGRELELPQGAKLNCIHAAKLLGIKIPHYCWHPSLSVVGSCRMCLVEIGTKDPKTGDIKMQPKLTPACNLIATDGLVLVTNSDKVQQARARVEEDLLLRHPIDCPICDKAGECKLQDYYFKYGQSERRADLVPFTSRRRDLGDVSLFVDRCIMCTRCVRFTAEISGSKELMIANRGAHEEINVVPGFPLNNKLSGNVVDLCPVGALADKDFLYKQRVWFIERHKGVCTNCAKGCSIWIDENQDRIYRIKPRENTYNNKWWICNDGRYGYSHVHSEQRITQPRYRDGDRLTDIDWATFSKEINKSLRDTGRLGAIVSPFLTVEEAYLLCKFIRSVDKKAVLALGPIPKLGEDEHYSKGFTIYSEKCPNRRGVEAVVAHFTGKLIDYEELVKFVEQGTIKGLWVSGGYKNQWVDEAAAKRFNSLKLLVVQDLFPSSLSQRANYQLPSGAFAEREGSYVNRADRLQTVSWAVRPPMGVRTEGSLYWELLGNKGLFNARTVLDEVARKISYFSAATGKISDLGLDLKTNMLA